MPMEESQAAPADWPDPLQLAPLPPLDLHPPLTPEGRQAIRCLVESINEYVLESRQKHGPESWAYKTEILTDQDADALCDLVVNLSYNGGEFSTPITHGHMSYEGSALIAVSHHLEPIQLVRPLVACGQIDPKGVHWGAHQTLQVYRRKRKLTLRELGALFRAVGVPSQIIASEYLDGWLKMFRWGTDETWPFFAEHIEPLSLALKGRGRSLFSRLASTGSQGANLNPENLDADPRFQSSALDALDCFPRVPPPLLEQLWEIALGPAKTFRARAQGILTKEPDCFPRVLRALESSQATRRSVAARWLGDLGKSGAVEPLQAALRKERNDFAKDAMMDALTSLGVPLEGIFDRHQMDKEATRNLAKRGVPPGLAWVPFDQLPNLRWRDTSEAVSQDTVTWWLVQADKAKSPEPGSRLRHQMQLVEQGCRESYGRALLQAWIDFDTMPPTVEQAQATAGKYLQRFQGLAGLLERVAPTHPEFEGIADEFPGKAELVEQLLDAPGGSAIGHKGLLAVCAACGGEATTQLAAEYIRRWYGVRAAQSKALVRMISWIDHPTAVQFLTAAAKRFRTRGIREEANRALQALAERKGWTVEEFADRMIPDGGLDEDGRMRLDFGSRSFFAEMDPGFRLHVRAEDGALRSDLPKPGKHDDPTRATEARRLFSRAKKQIREVVREQTARLFCAMCSERRWELGAWSDTLLRHPIAGLLCRRLVWRAVGTGAVLFRPRGGGDFVDATDRVVELASTARIYIAHDHNTPPEQSVPWIEHLRGYAIEPLFPQFQRGLPELTPSMLEGESIDDFQGFVLGGYTLRNYARKLGYFRGDAQDGPQFFHYYKPYLDLRIEVRLEFSGNNIPEDDRLVALERMVFERSHDPPIQGPRWPNKLALADVPPILLLESFAI